MVMMKKNAFTMIELVFAIVIIAIGVISLPMMTQVTTQTTANNLQYDEAIFEAYVKAVEATDEPFASVSAKAKAPVLDANASGSLAGLKFRHKYDIAVNTPVSFDPGVAATSDIKKVTVTIYDENDNILTRVYTYKFNM